MKVNTKKTVAAAIAAILLTSGAIGGSDLSSKCVASNVVIASAAETEAGTYSVKMTLMQFHTDEVSMGNASMNPMAHIVVNNDGTAELHIDMRSMTYMEKQGYLGWMKKVTEIVKANMFQYPLEVNTVDVPAIEEYTDVYDDFNNPDSKYADSNVVGKWYPKVLSLPIDFENREDEILVQVYVPVMESIMSGGGTKFADIDLDREVDMINRQISIVKQI